MRPSTFVGVVARAGGVVGGGGGYVQADDYSVASGATVTLSFVSTVLNGNVTADDYAVSDTDPVVLEFAQ